MDKGAHFYRCDLQVHTPRDTNWSGAEVVADEERLAYARNLVQACRDRHLDAIAITDHHDMLFVSYVRRAAAEETDEQGQPLPKERQLVVFPGMELTLAVPCQALLLFDADLPEDLFDLVMNALAITPSSSSASKIADVQRLNIQSLRSLQADLDKHAYLRGRYIIFPNVGENGQFSLLRKGQALKYVEMPCVGGYVDGDLAKLGLGNEGILAGKNKEWGGKRLACFQTSDSRRDDHKNLGLHSTWIKWAAPTGEALRQACLAQESRISQDTPRLPAVSISSISVSNSSFLGPVDLEFNRQYSALIGGRGTGKSTILEYLRWALCDQPPDILGDDVPNYQARRGRLIDETLKPLGSTVELRLDVNGVSHIVRRNSKDGSLLIKIGADDMRPCSEEEVRSLLPVQAYSQKQLSDVSVRIEELSRFLTAPIRSDLVRLDRQTTDRTERVRQAYAARQRYRGLLASLRKNEIEERSLLEQANALRSSLTGLRPEDRALLERGKLFDAADLAMQSWVDSASVIGNATRVLQATLDRFVDQVKEPPQELEAEILERASTEYLNFLALAKDVVDSVVAHSDRLAGVTEGAAENRPWAEWASKLGEFRASYDAAVQRSSVHQERMQQLRMIEEQIAVRARESSKVRDEIRTMTSAESKYEEERAAWESSLLERDTMLETQCETLTQASGGLIRAGLRRFLGIGRFTAALTHAVSGSRMHTNKIDNLGDEIWRASDPARKWNSILHELESLAEFGGERDSSEGRPDCPTLSSSGLSDADLDRIVSSLEPEVWLNISLTPIPSVPLFEYRARENKYIPFRDASAGQQATALLKTLLSQSGPPLIIDQPEEDLDNPSMPEIVQQVWTAKQKRQIVFASHNANLVVNGDAELVVWCDYRTSGDQSRSTITGEGAIDVPVVREAIKRIMEGGEAAFNLRKQKYGF